MEASFGETIGAILIWGIGIYAVGATIFVFYKKITIARPLSKEFDFEENKFNTNNALLAKYASDIGIDCRYSAFSEVNLDRIIFRKKNLLAAINMTEPNNKGKKDEINKKISDTISLYEEMAKSWKRMEAINHEMANLPKSGDIFGD